MSSKHHSGSPLSSSAPASSLPAAVERPCHLCGTTDWQTIGKLDRRRQPLHTVICRSCGLICHAAIPSESELAEYYGKNYRQDYNGEHTPSGYRLVREWKRGHHLFNRLRPYLQSHGSVFELGAGMGCNLKHFQLAGYRAAGIEPGEGFCRYGREQLRVDLQCANWQDVSQRHCHDLVMLVHVLEHLRDPLAPLRRCTEMLKPHGLIYVEVPNVAAPHASPDKLFHYAHIYNFTPTTLERALREAGFELVARITGLNSRSIGLLARKLNAPAWSGPPVSGYDEAWNGVHRYSPLTYRLRGRYIVQRMRELYYRIADRLTARSQHALILQQCQQTPALAAATSLQDASLSSNRKHHAA